MKPPNKLIALILAGFVIFIHCPNTAFSQDVSAKNEPAIQNNPIEMHSTPNEALASDTKKKSNWWLWGLLGVVIIGSVAALAGSGDDGGGSGSDPPPSVFYLSRRFSRPTFPTATPARLAVFRLSSM